MTWGYGPSKRSTKFAYDAPFPRYFNFSEKRHFSEKVSSQERNVCSIQTFFIIKHFHKSNYCFNWTFLWYKKLYWKRKNISQNSQVCILYKSMHFVMYTLKQFFLQFLYKSMKIYKYTKCTFLQVHIKDTKFVIQVQFIKAKMFNVQT